MLPIPMSNPLIELPPPTAAEFEDMDAPEDEALLDTGAWDDELGDESNGEEDDDGAEGLDQGSGA